MLARDGNGVKWQAMAVSIRLHENQSELTGQRLGHRATHPRRTFRRGDNDARVHTYDRPCDGRGAWNPAVSRHSRACRPRVSDQPRSARRLRRMSALFALVIALLSLGGLNPVAPQIHAQPACGLAKDPNGGCDPGTLRPRSRREPAHHGHVGPDCSSTTEPNGCGT